MNNELKHSEDFLKKKLGKTPSFSVPKNYFDDVEHDISTKISSSFFSEKPGFKVPDSYFENLEFKITEPESVIQKKTKVISFKERLLRVSPYIAAASIVLFICLNTFIFNGTEDFTFDSVSDTEIEYWLDENTVSTNEVAILLENDILEENAFSMTEIEDETIEDYLNSIDQSSILNDF